MALHHLQITPYYLPDVAFGGPVFSVSSLCEALVATGARVTVYTIGYQPEKQYPFKTTINASTMMTPAVGWSSEKAIS